MASRETRRAPAPQQRSAANVEAQNVPAALLGAGSAFSGCNPPTSTGNVGLAGMQHDFSGTGIDE